MNIPKLFVTDLDKTALGGGYRPYRRFPDVFSAFLDKLDSVGCRWAINTTWAVEGQWELVLASSVRSRPVFLMGELGHRLSAVEDEEPVPVEPFTTETDEAVSSVREKFLYPLVKDISGRFCPLMSHFYGHLFEFSIAPEERAHFLEYVSDRYSSDENLIVQYSEKGLIAYPAFLNKGRSLKETVGITGIAPGDVVVAGDNVADTMMMKPGLALNAICPGNADEDVKRYVMDMGGEVGCGECAEGVIDAFTRLAEKKGWDWGT